MFRKCQLQTCLELFSSLTNSELLFFTQNSDQKKSLISIDETMMTRSSSLSLSIFSSLILLLQAISPSGSITKTDQTQQFSIKEATLADLQLAFKQNILTSRELVEFYIGEINRLNPVLRGVIEVNPDALDLADKADQERKEKTPRSLLGGLHGIPVLVKDNIATKDKLNTTAGSFALLGSVVPKNAFVVSKLIEAGAIILGKGSMSEWAHVRGNAPDGWCARSGQGKNPYVLSADTCGSSSGPAISVAANMVAVSIGTETDGSILCPSSYNSVVGIKPTVGLTSRDGAIPVALTQDTIGPIARTVADAVYVLDVIAGFDENDEGTIEASKYIPLGGYKQFLKPEGLKGKRLGIVRHPFVEKESDVSQAFELHVQTLRKEGAIVEDDLEITNIDDIMNPYVNGEAIALASEFKVYLNEYLQNLVASPVRSLAEVIAFNNKFSELEKIKEYGQFLFEMAQSTEGIDNEVKEALSNLERLSREGFEKLIIERNLDAVVTPGWNFATVLAIGGYPGISVPAGYDQKGVPFGIFFGGLKGMEPKLIEISYGFEQATKIRKSPSFHSVEALRSA